ncbi:MAG: lipoyl(octanoyl) transferase LipB [Myxococcales bacterium]|nr:lipoyl(octanoyl) transferase LipB [Myxococcales bacterium]
MLLDTSDQPEMMPRALEIVHAGRLSYSDGLRWMEDRVKQRVAGACPDQILLLEHNPVITLGRRADVGHILADASVLAELGVEMVETGRGGDVTYHGPGQVVGYPVLSLAPERKNVKRYVADLEDVMIDLCLSYGLHAQRSEGEIGCWVDGDRKIGAIGVRISKWVTSHGFAFNVCPNMGHFGLIVPCGIVDKPVTSLALELERSPPIKQVVSRFVDVLHARFGERVPDLGTSKPSEK